MRFYDPKPYLLVKRRADLKGGPIVKTEVVVLPDVQCPHFIAEDLGPSSCGYKVTLKNGMLTQLQVTPDSRSLDVFGSTTTQFKAIIDELLKREQARIAFDALNKPPPTPPSTTPQAGADPTPDLGELTRFMESAEVRNFLHPNEVDHAADLKSLEGVRTAVLEFERIEALLAGGDAEIALQVLTLLGEALPSAGASPSQKAIERRARTIVDRSRERTSELVKSGRTKERRALDDLLKEIREAKVELAARVSAREKAASVFDEIRALLREIAAAKWVETEAAKDDILKRLDAMRLMLLPMLFSESGDDRATAAIANRVLVLAKELVKATPVKQTGPSPCPPPPAPPPNYDDGKTPVYFELYEMVIERDGYRLRKVEIREEVMALLQAIGAAKLPITNEISAK